MARGGGGAPPRQLDPLPVIFSKMYLLERGWSPGFLVTFLVFFYQKSHLSWKFYWTSSSRSEDTKIFSVNINYFHHFLDFLTFPCCKETNKSAYNKSCCFKVILILDISPSWNMPSLIRVKVKGLQCPD